MKNTGDKIYRTSTIIAPATIPGTGAITVIRMSGPDTFNILDKSIKFLHGTANESKGYRIKFGSVYSENGKPLDDVLVSIFRGTNSYTGEDSAEISCHASSYIARTLMEILIKNGAEAAGPGEFTQRAFINGKMDLAEAEAVADVIAAENEASHRIAFSQLKGGVSNELDKMRASLLEITSLMELELDFSEEDVEFADRTHLNNLIDSVNSRISELIDSFKLGNAIKNGIPTAIVGATNTGKSTLLNALLNEERAIVSNIAGTTRDTIEESITIGGISFRFIDTAGIRETEETIEKIGIERTYKKIDEADIVLGMLNIPANTSNTNELSSDINQIISKVNLEKQKLIFLINKIDELFTADSNTSNDKEVIKTQEENITKAINFVSNIIVNTLNNYVSCDDNKEVNSNITILPLSAKNNEGIDKLKSKLAEYGSIATKNDAMVMVTNTRHLEALKKTLESLNNVKKALALGIPTDLVAQDLREAIYHLGTITGEISTDEVLGNIFRNFCIGK